MKFISIMRNLFVLAFSVLIGSALNAQNASNSPYSSFGIGELGGMDHAVYLSLGNSTITMADSTTLNFYNPASYNSLGKGQPIFSLGVSSRLSTFSEQGVSSQSSITGVQHFAIAFPFAKHFGLAFGLKPYSRRGYEFTSKTKINNDSLYHIYSGDGSINEVFVGFSSNVLKLNKSRVSIGANFGYLFGKVTNTRKSGLVQSGSTTMSGGINQQELKANNLHFEFGINYFQQINELHSFTLSATYDPLQKINGAFREGQYYSADIENENGYDTLFYNDSTVGNTSTVPSFNIGLNYNLDFQGRKGSTKEMNSQVAFHLSYGSSDWSSYENTYDPNFTNNFLNSSRYSFGVQYTPEKDFIANKATTKFFSRIRYRAGTYYTTLPYQTNGEQVTDFGTTFGFGIPIAVQNSLSSINFGFSIGNRGISDENAFKERYYGINIGIAIAPGADRWFVKRKLN